MTLSRATNVGRVGQALLVCGIAASMLPQPSGAEAKGSGFRVLYSFGGNADGAGPEANLFAGGKGILYSTTAGGGGPDPNGRVFRITSKGIESTVYAFGSSPDGNSPDRAGVIGDSKGNLYGSTAYGGQAASGTIYKVAPDGTETVLYSFCSQTGCEDGQDPEATLIMDGSGNLYGTTAGGGPNGGGVVFELSAAGIYTALYGFCHKTNCADGTNPYGTLLRDTSGNLYGTTANGGGVGCGVVFKLGTDGTQSVLHSFTDGKDGCGPYGGVIQDGAGDLYGTANSGGSGNGTVYEIAADGSFSVVYTFKGGTDGSGPNAAVVEDASGNLYGTTTRGGGGNGYGTVFKVTPQGKETVLHSFNGSDGQYPVTTLLAVKGRTATILYGTAEAGGANRDGTVFRLAE